MTLDLQMVREIIQYNLPLILGIMVLVLVFLLFFCILLLVKIKNQKKRYDFFMGTNRRPSLNLETTIQKYYQDVKEIEKKYEQLVDMVNDLDETMKCNIQKVGFVRYNPFDEMGGNLCFAVALLDGNDNGVVINGIHSRTGSFTYAKSIEMGVSIYTLSEEEKKAIEIAKENTYHPKAKKVLKVKPKKQFHHKFVEENSVQDGENKNIDAEKKESIGDVTESEKKCISEEEQKAQEIAIAVHQEIEETPQDISCE